jgi:hypothetical protein
MFDWLLKSRLERTVVALVMLGLTLATASAVATFVQHTFGELVRQWP